MPATRSNRPSKLTNHSKIKDYVSTKKPYDFIIHLMEVMSETNLKPQVMVPITGAIQMMEQQLQNKSLILMGPGHSGKSSTVYWLIRNQLEYKIVIWMDCRIWQTEHTFINELIEQLSLSFNRPISKTVVKKGDINLKQLSYQIKKQDKQVVIVMKCPQKLREKRPVLLYNILEWINIESSHQNLNFIMLTRDIRFVDSGEKEKRVQSRMNTPIIYLSRPKGDKIKEIIRKRIVYSLDSYPHKNKQQYLNNQSFCKKLQKSFDQKQMDKILTFHYEQQIYPISYYLKLMQLIFTLNIQSQERSYSLTQKDLNSIVINGFQSYNVYITDHRNMAKCFFSIMQQPEIILLGLFRNRFLRQKEGNYHATITLGELMNDFNVRKGRVKIDDGGSSFLFGQNIMENALRNLMDWNFLAFAKTQRVSAMNRQLICRYGPQEIQILFKHCEGIPNIIKTIYMDSV